MAVKASPQKNTAGGRDAGDILPGQEEAEQLLVPLRAFMSGEKTGPVRARMDRLAGEPPQVLLLEGGTAGERLSAAFYWALLLNCGGASPAAPASRRPPAQTLSLFAAPAPEPEAAAEETHAEERPCLRCSSCLRIAARMHRDCFLFDGTAGSIKIDEVRALKSVLGEAPREARYRAALFYEAQAMAEPAANALLKSLEEPRAASVFVLTAPQRERLLPTLVSRSFILTLPWPRGADPAREELLAPWEAALCSFALNGSGLFEKSAVKGNLDARTAHALVDFCTRALVEANLARQSGAERSRKVPEGHASRPASAANAARLFASVPETRLPMLYEALAECRESLDYAVNPALVLEWLATRLYFLLPGDRGGKAAGADSPRSQEQ
ncbi:MAG: DNA polymerase III subunit delta' [Desulfovibrio sp.]|jgi:DNA polymerase-3 subunit delta'|nr:DNA polymerase III subunit delta' [Desulfovibrio sp.]